MLKGTNLTKIVPERIELETYTPENTIFLYNILFAIVKLDLWVVVSSRAGRDFHDTTVFD